MGAIDADQGNGTAPETKGFGGNDFGRNDLLGNGF